MTSPQNSDFLSPHVTFGSINLTPYQAGEGWNPPASAFYIRCFITDQILSTRPWCKFIFWCLEELRKKNWGYLKKFLKKMRSKKKIARKWGKNHVPLLYDVHSDPWTDGPNHWNSGDFRCLKVDIGTRFHFRSFLIDFDEKYGSNGSKIWAGGIHPPPAYTSTKKPGQIRVNPI